MAKKVVFLLVMMFVLLIASVTAFAAGPQSATPEAGFTEDKANVAEVAPEVSISDLEIKYADIFFGDVKSTKEIVPIIGERVYPHELRHVFTGMALEIDKTTNPVIMLMYIKVDGIYVPLVDVNTGSHVTQEPYCLKTTVDLKYLGSNKVNDIRIIVFRKNDVEKLTADENLQITDLKISVRSWNLFDRAANLLKEIFN